MLPAMGSRQQGPHSTPARNDDVTHTTLPVMISLLEVEEDIKKQPVEV